MAGLFPRIVRERCHPSIPTAACPWRREAEMLGKMRYDRIAMAWIVFGEPAYEREMTNGKKLLRWQKVQRNNNYDTTGDLLLLEICPGCGCELPDGDGED